MLEKRIVKEQAAKMQAWHMPVLDASGAILPSHEKQLKEGKSESIQHLSAYLQNGRLTSDVLEKLHQQIYEEGLAKGQAEGYKSGYDQGFQKGQLAGHQSGYQEGKNKAEKEALRLNALFDRLFQPLQDQQDRVEQWMLQTIKSICLAIMQRECKSDETLLLPFVKEAVASLPVNSKKISVTLHPEDMELVTQFAKQKSIHWNMFPDAELLRGDCRIASEVATVDYTLGARVEQALEVLLSTPVTLEKNNESGNDAAFRH